jgi:hypothetical protein
VQPETEAQAPAADTANLFEGTSVNPDELPEDLQPLAKQLQAAFTQKTQEIAAQRKQIESVLELGVDPAELTNLYTRVADPQQWPQLAAELAEAAKEYGVELPGFAAAPAPAAEQPAEPLSHTEEIPDDPELAPLKAELQRLQQRLDAADQGREQEAADREMQSMQTALVNEFTRMETSVRESNPHYDDSDMDDVYERSAFFGGDLLKAQANKAAQDARAVERYIARKQAAAANKSVAPAPAGHDTTAATPPQIRTLKDAEAEAIEFFNARLGDEDFSLAN